MAKQKKTPVKQMRRKKKWGCSWKTTPATPTQRCYQCLFSVRRIQAMRRAMNIIHHNKSFWSPSRRELSYLIDCSAFGCGGERKHNIRTEIPFTAECSEHRNSQVVAALRRKRTKCGARVSVTPTPRLLCHLLPSAHKESFSGVKIRANSSQASPRRV